MRLGLTTFMWYLLICLFSNALAIWVPNIDTMVVSFSLILTIILWYEAMKKGIKISVLRSLVIMLWFLIPSVILTGLKYWTSLNHNIYFDQMSLIYTFFHLPFALSIMKLFGDYNELFVLFIPAIIIAFMLMIILLNHIIQLFETSRDFYVGR